SRDVGSRRRSRDLEVDVVFGGERACFAQRHPARWSIGVVRHPELRVVTWRLDLEDGDRPDGFAVDLVLVLEDDPEAAHPATSPAGRTWPTTRVSAPGPPQASAQPSRSRSTTSRPCTTPIR